MTKQFDRMREDTNYCLYAYKEGWPNNRKVCGRKGNTVVCAYGDDFPLSEPGITWIDGRNGSELKLEYYDCC